MSRNVYMTTYSSDFGNPGRSRSNRGPSNQPGFSRHVENRRNEQPPDVNKPRSQPSRERIQARSGNDGVARHPTNEFIDVQGEIDDFDERLELEELEVSRIDTLASSNAVNHHTEEYDAVDSGTLVVRRGQPFDIVVKFNRKVNFKKDNLRLVFEAGPNPTSVKWTRVECLLGAQDDATGWKVMVKKKLSDNELLLTVFTSPECVVSHWRMYLQAIQTIEGRTKPMALSDVVEFFILFNPWNKEDAVYFPDEKGLNEYVLNDTGVLFTGNYEQIGAQPWNFGQFDRGVLEAALYCMQRGLNGDFDKPMGDPVRVSRAISKIVNSPDDKGVLQGKWGGGYQNGTAPMKWTGSVSILRQFMESKNPVKYGQCWVFSGVTTTVCRALGLPCRSVTNFESAHDTDGNVTIDRIVNMETGKVIPGASKDSIWNFHVWNEVWMQRRDLGAKNVDGWQVVDATPQERSRGKFQCGPTSVIAIKNGITDLLFDGPFVFAEVNGDEIFWGQEKDGRKTVVKIDKSRIGKCILTKNPNINRDLHKASYVKMDITDEYKYKEESKQENNAVLKAMRLAHNRKPVYNAGGINDVDFSGFEKKDYVYIGDDFQIGGVIRNTGTVPRSVEATISCVAISYDGREKGEVKKQTFAGVLQPKQNNRTFMEVKERDYINIIDEQGSMAVYLFVKVLETDQRSVWEDSYRLRRPLLTIESATRAASVGQPCEFTVSFKNPLPDLPLTSCYVTVEGPVEEAGRKLSIRDIGPGEYWKAVMCLHPRKEGRGRPIIITFNSDKIQNVTGDIEIDIYRR